MKRLSIASVIVMLFAFTSLTQSSIDAEGVATGKTVLRFYGTQVAALIESDKGPEGDFDD